MPSNNEALDKLKKGLRYLISHVVYYEKIDFKPTRAQIVNSLTDRVSEFITAREKAHNRQLLEAILEQVVPYKTKMGLDVAQLWDSADATDGYNQAISDVQAHIKKLLTEEG